MLDDNTKTGLESQLNCCGLLNTNSTRTQFEEDVQNCRAVRCYISLFLS